MVRNPYSWAVAACLLLTPLGLPAQDPPPGEPAAVVPAAGQPAPVPAAPAAPAAVKPAPEERPRPVITPKPAEKPPVSEPPRVSEPAVRSVETPAPAAVTTPVPAAAANGPAGGGPAVACWLLAFAMLIVGFAAGFVARHFWSRRQLGGMQVRIGTWRGIP